METRSPSVSTSGSLPVTVTCFLAKSMARASAPQTHGAPMPRAMTAACEVLPPRLVRMPSEAIMPTRSSGLVSVRTRMTRSPRAAHSAASLELSTIRPTAAPGLAATALVSTRTSPERSKRGNISSDSC
jgi:hypothetical protein